MTDLGIHRYSGIIDQIFVHYLATRVKVRGTTLRVVERLLAEMREHPG